jgi:hypothetical protein
MAGTQPSACSSLTAAHEDAACRRHGAPQKLAREERARIRGTVFFAGKIHYDPPPSVLARLSPRLNQTSTAQLDLFLNPTAQETTPGELWCTFGPDQLFQCVCRSCGR